MTTYVSAVAIPPVSLSSQNSLLAASKRLAAQRMAQNRTVATASRGSIMAGLNSGNNGQPPAASQPTNQRGDGSLLRACKLRSMRLYGRINVL
jgi:hypothetical protein